MTLNLRGDGTILYGGTGRRRGLRQFAHTVQVRQMCQCEFFVYTEVDQAGDLVDTQALEVVHDSKRTARVTEQPGRFKVTLKGIFEQPLHLLIG